jgi:hypothetical protein
MERNWKMFNRKYILILIKGLAHPKMYRCKSTSMMPYLPLIILMLSP